MRVQLSNVAYTGGHPSYPDPAKGLVLVADDDGLHVRRFRQMFTMSWNAMRSVAIEGPEQAAKRVTATRLATLGVFAFAAKKTTSDVYMHIVTGGYEAGFQVPKMSVGDLRSRLGRWISQIPSSSSHAASATPPPPAAALSVADELTKLAQLRDTGVLSPAEFDAQKARLLGA